MSHSNEKFVLTSNEMSEVMTIFRKETEKYNLTDNQLKNIVETFQEYYQANIANKDEWVFWSKKYDFKTHTYINNLRSIDKIISSYISQSNYYAMYESIDVAKDSKFINPDLNRAYFYIYFKHIMIREAQKMGVEYNEILMDNFWNWYMNYDNKELSHYRDIHSNEIKYYRKTIPKSVKNYIKSIPKTFIY